MATDATATSGDTMTRLKSAERQILTLRKGMTALRREMRMLSNGAPARPATGNTTTHSSTTGTTRGRPKGKP